MEIRNLLGDRPLRLGEVGAIAPIGATRRAALLYDRVFFPTAPLPGFEGLEEHQIPPLELTFGTHDDTRLYADEGAMLGISAVGGNGYALHYGFNLARRALADSYSSLGQVAIPLFHKGLLNSEAYKSGLSAAYEAALLQLPVVSEEDVSR